MNAHTYAFDAVLHKVEGIDGELNPEDFVAEAISSATPENGTFVSSDSLINRLQSNIKWGMLDNFVDIPTDCPQRDERLGWTGDAQVSIRAITCTFDGKRFFSKWLRDMAAEQRGDGTVSHFVPNVGLFTKDPALFCGGSAWATTTSAASCYP